MTPDEMRRAAEVLLDHVEYDGSVEAECLALAAKLRALADAPAAIRALVDEQAEDEGLWVEARLLREHADATARATRFEVIDHTCKGVGRCFVHYNVNVTLAFQDEGKTLKVFLTDITAPSPDTQEAAPSQS